MKIGKIKNVYSNNFKSCNNIKFHCTLNDKLANKN